jgi:hypothetical protein
MKIRAAVTALATAALFALLAPAAFAQASGEGLYGELNDIIITKANFLVIGFFPAFIFLVSLLQWKLDKRKDAKKAAVKSRSGSQVWNGGW